MTNSDALKEAARRLGFDPWSARLLNPQHPDYDPRYWEHVRQVASTPAQPSLATKAVNFGRAVVSHARAGFPTVDDAIYQARLDTCHACPNLVLPGWICGGPKGCGCNLKLKARWAEQKCPLSKWEV